MLDTEKNLDEIILNSYKDTAKGIAKMFGSHCEVVIHSLENYESAVIAIENAHNSDRKVGSPITDFALEIIKKVNTSSYEIDPYESKFPNGNNCRSITIPIKNKDILIGLMCINFNLDVSLLEFMNNFLTSNSKEVSAVEHYSSRVEDLMELVLNKHMEEVLLDVSIPNQDKNRKIILKLNDIGFFQLKGSIETLADKLQISVHTIYSYIRNYSKYEKASTKDKT